MTDPCQRKEEILSDIKGVYDEWISTYPIEPDSNGKYPPISRGETIDICGLIYPATHLILNPREDRTEEDRSQGRKMMLRAIRQGIFRRPGHPCHGIWYWKITGNGEVPPYDRNTPGFAGCGLVRAWVHDPQEFSDWPQEEFAEFKEAVKISVEAAERDWVRLGYTNPQFLDLFLSVAASKLLGEPGYRNRAMERFRKLMAFAHTQDSFEEWLSPTYGGVNLTGLVPVVDVTRGSSEHRELADALAYQWRLIAAAAHNPTSEVCGPHSRAYDDTASEQTGGLYGWLHLAAPDTFPLNGSVSVFKGLAAPGLYMDLCVPDDVIEVLYSDFNEPRQDRLNYEWIGACGWELPDDVDIEEIEQGSEHTDRFRLGTSFRTSEYCIGSVNEIDSWVQRRPCLVYWNDAQGETTGIKVHALSETAQDPVGLFSGQNIEFISLQHNNTLLGTFYPARTVTGYTREDIPAPAYSVRITQNDPAFCSEPVGVFLGTHWRQPVAQEFISHPVKRVWLGFTPVGNGTWERLDSSGTAWRFYEHGIEVLIRLHCTGSIMKLPNRAKSDEPVECLTMKLIEDIEWDLLDPPDICTPFSLRVQNEQGDREIPLSVDTGSQSNFNLTSDTLTLSWTCPDSPADVTKRLWRGWVDEEELTV